MKVITMYEGTQLVDTERERERETERQRERERERERDSVGQMWLSM